MLPLPFSEVWATDFEFRPKDGREGNLPDPICLVAHELKSGRKIRLWRDEFGPFPPYSVGPDSSFRGVLRKRRDRLPPGARLAEAGAHPRPIHRAPLSHKRPPRRGA